MSRYRARHRGATPHSWTEFDGIMFGSIAAFVMAEGIVQWLRGIS